MPERVILTACAILCTFCAMRAVSILYDIRYAIVTLVNIANMRNR